MGVLEMRVAGFEERAGELFQSGEPPGARGRPEQRLEVGRRQAEAMTDDRFPLLQRLHRHAKLRRSLFDGGRVQAGLQRFPGLSAAAGEPAVKGSDPLGVVVRQGGADASLEILRSASCTPSSKSKACRLS